MKFEIAAPPAALSFGEGEDAFKIRIRRWDAAQRAMVFDAFASGSLLQMQATIEPLVLSWEGILRPDGTPIPLDYEDEGRHKRRNFDLVLGQMSVAMQMRVLGGIAEFIGVPAEGLLDVATRLKASVGDLRPTGAQASDTPASA